MKDAGPYLGLGVQLAGTMVVWVLAGWLLDRWLDTTPWLTIAGGGIGMVAFFFQMMRLLAKMNNDHPRGNASDDPSGGTT